jgi:release factor glutamine methyltransferase
MIAPLRPADPPRAWTISDLLVWTEGHFKKLGFSTPRLDAEVLLAHALSASRIELYTGYHKVVEPPERERFRGLVERRARGEPVAYITGAREFHSLRFEVSPAVLIPRPETEHLVDAVVEQLRGGPPPRESEPAPPVDAAARGAPQSAAPAPAAPPAAEGPAPAAPAAEPVLPPAAETAPLRVLDLGTGSGNIAVAIAVQLPEARIVAIDLSPVALEVARRNAAAHGVAARIEFLEGDLFAPLEALSPEPRFQAIVSNPPYILPSAHAGLSPDVRDFEPRLALLDTKENEAGRGIGFHRAIVREARRFLAPGGLLAVEVGEGQAAGVEDLFRAAGFAAIRRISDYGGIQRVILGTV